ncbi:uncharacterized protein LOC107803690 [Nicotiana tabacum]|uniref:Uncharacterized protein LOC107803690 n=1 Tax=Nicotiana tabacum TaxID=4097 RepID=A0AC58STV5_TOBAC
MDFVSGLPCTQRNHDAIWVIVDKLTKSAHFLAIRMDYSLERLAELYINEIVRLHGIPISIVFDRDPRFVSIFWSSLQESLGSRLNFSTAFHPQTDGQSERVIQTPEDMLRACIIEFESMPTYEALYGRKCRTPLCWNKVGERKLVGPEIVQQTEDKVKIIKDRLKISSDKQKSYADLKRREIEHRVGDKSSDLSDPELSGKVFHRSITLMKEPKSIFAGIYPKKDQKAQGRCCPDFQF